VVCPSGFACDETANTCVSTLCTGVSCGAGTSCDVTDGQCKCGGAVCQDSEFCNPATKSCQTKRDCADVACPSNQTCEPSTGLCSCAGAACNAGESCVQASNGSFSCVADHCSGVTCLGSTSCDPADGICKCNGNTCTSGEICACPPGADAGTCADAARFCQEGNDCAGVTCTAGTTCDPIDGQCKCGGPGGPVCGANQVCSTATGLCQGGDQCTVNGSPKQCTGGTSCDPEDGLCKCGGRGGTVCSDGTDGRDPQMCAIAKFTQSCKAICDPRQQNCSVPGQYCYFDTTLKIPGAYCDANSATQTNGQSCLNPTACFTTNPTSMGMFCSGLGTFDSPGVGAFCRPYCEVSAGSSGCVQQLGVFVDCIQITGAAAGVGACIPQN
jgi:hypothetical protein